MRVENSICIENNERAINELTNSVNKRINEIFSNLGKKIIEVAKQAEINLNKLNKKCKIRSTPVFVEEIKEKEVEHPKYPYTSAIVKLLTDK